jgi:ubiquitin carboxyl-terminal hydrolase 9/24
MTTYNYTGQLLPAVARGSILDVDEDLNGEEKLKNDTETNEEQQLQLRNREESTREYNVNILKQLQVIIGHLASSKLQYYTCRAGSGAISRCRASP